MLSQKHRLTKTADVTLTTAKGRSFFNPFFVLKSLQKKEIDLPKWTVVASTKVSTKATVRNKYKRAAREAIYQNISRIKPGFYVLILKKSATTIEPQDLQEKVVQALQKARLFNK